MSDDAAELPAEEVEVVRAEANRVVDAHYPSKASAARDADIPPGTFYAWLDAKYQGNNAKIGAAVKRWLRAREEHRDIRIAAPVAPGFILTPGAEEFLLALRHAQVLSDFAIITGAPGTGKTAAVCHYAKTTPNVFKVTVMPMAANAKAVMDDLGMLMGVIHGRSGRLMSLAIIAKLKGRDALIIVDEANHLPSTAIDQLRSIHDQSGCGMVLVGNETVLARVEGGSRASEFAQLSSRVGMKVRRPKVKLRDAEMLLDAWGVEGKAERDLLRAIANRPGALRLMTKVLRMAFMLARSADKPLAVPHIEAAWAQLGNQPLGRAG